MVSVDSTKGIAPNTGKKSIHVQLSSVASDDTVDVSTLEEPLSNVSAAFAYDQTNGAQITAGASGTTITLDSGNAKSGLDVGLIVFGDA